MMDLSATPFNFENFIRVGNGLNKIDKESWRRQLIDKNLMDIARKASIQLKKEKSIDLEQSISHVNYIKNILAKTKYKN
jgi:hypothetical protein